MKHFKALLENEKFIYRSLLLLSLLISIFIYREVSRTQLVAWDESGYIWQAYVARTAFVSDWTGGLWEVSRNQVLYPFLQSWYLGFMSLFFGFSINSIRLASTLLFIPATILMWSISRMVIPQRNILRLLPVSLFLTSPMMAYYFSTAMKEGLGVVLTLLCFYLYFRAKEKSSSILYFMTSLSLLAFFLTKYNYAVLVAVPLVAESSWNILSGKGKWQSLGWLFIPFGIGFIWWVFLTHNIANALWFVLRNDTQYNLDQTNTLGHLLYYPQEIIFSYLLHPALAVLVVAGLFLSLKNWRSMHIRVLAVFFFLNFFLGASHMGNNQARFIFTSIPALFLLTGIGLSFLPVRKISLRPHFKVTVVGLVLLGSLLFGRELLDFPTRVRSTGSYQVGSAVFYETDYSPNLRFNFNLADWPRDLPSSEKLTGQTVDDVFKFVFSQTDPNGMFFLVGRLNELSPGLFNLKVALEKKGRGVFFQNSDQLYFVVVQVEPQSRFANFDYQTHYPKDLVEKVLKMENLSPVSRKEFPYLGMTVSILEKAEGVEISEEMIREIQRL